MCSLYVKSIRHSPFYISQNVCLAHKHKCYYGLFLFQMIQGYADFMYQTALVDESQRDYFAIKSQEASILINQKKWLDAVEVYILILLSDFELAYSQLNFIFIQTNNEQ